MSRSSKETEIFMYQQLETSKDIEKRKYASLDGSKKWEYLAIFVCALLYLSNGMDVGWNSPGITLLLSPDSQIPFNTSDIPTVTISMSIGHLVSIPINMFLLDRIGRKYSILLSGLPLIGSFGLIIIGKNLTLVIVARVLSGIALGCGFVVIPLYLGEISSVTTRGVNGTLLNLAIVLGVLISYIIVPCMPIRTSAAVYFFLSIFFIILFSFMPKSPYYLAMRGRTEEVEETLVKLRGKINVTDELTMIVEFVNKDNKNEARFWRTFKQIFTIREYRRAFFIALLFNVIIYLDGFIIILGYGHLIFQDTVGPFSAYTINIAVAVGLLLSPIPTMLCIDKFGRKPLILPAGIIVSLCAFIIGSYFFAKDYLNTDVSSFSFLPLLAPILVFFHNFGIGSVWTVLSSEIFAIEVKAVSACLINMIDALFAIIINELYIFIAISLNYGHSVPFFGFSLITLVTTVFLFFFAPETKNRTFNEIQRKLQNR